MKTLALSLLISLTAGQAFAAPLNSITDTDLRAMSDRQYALIIGDAVKAGRIYPREQVVSGAHRHFINLRDRYIGLGYTIVPGSGS